MLTSIFYCSYELNYKFEREVDSEAIKAKFNKKQHTLTLTLKLI